MKTLALIDENFNLIKKVNHISNDYNYEASEKVLDVSKLIKYTILNNLPYGVDVLVPFNNGNDFVFVHPNPFILKITNASYDDFLGRKISDVLPLHNKLGITDILKETYKTGELKTFKTMSYEDNNFVHSFKHYIFQENGYFFIISMNKTELELIENLTNDLFYNSSKLCFL